MGFSDEVIIVLLKYVMERNNNRMPENFIGSIAGTWMRNGVETREDALKAIKDYEEWKANGFSNEVDTGYLIQYKNSDGTEWVNYLYEDCLEDADEILFALKRKNKDTQFRVMGVRLIKAWVVSSDE